MCVEKYARNAAKPEQGDNDLDRQVFYIYANCSISEDIFQMGDEYGSTTISNDRAFIGMTNVFNNTRDIGEALK